MYSLLYVDDEPGLLEIGKLFLEVNGDFSVTTINSASAALDLLKEENFAAIISDYQMPEMNGITFLKKLKASGNTTPFIIFTGKGREEVVIEALNEGADFYLQKGGDPVSQFAELAHKVRSAISHKKAEKLAKDTERRLYDIINFLPDATFAIDTIGKVIAWNRAIEEMTGIPATEMLGKGDYEYAIPFYGVRRPILIDVVSISDEELSRDYYAIVKKEGDILIAETTLPRPMGRYSVLLGKATLLYNDEGEAIGAIESIRDITEQKRAEEELRKARDEYVDLLEHMNDVYYRSDTEGRLILASKSWVKDLGYDDLSECLGKNIADTFYANPAERKRFVEEVNRNGSVSDYEVILKKKDGTALPVATSSYLYFDDSGNVLGIEGTWRDITERKQAEETILRINESLYRQTKSLSILSRIITTVNKAVNRQQLLDEILDETLTLLDYDAGGIYLVDHTAGRAEIVCSKNISPGFISEIGNVSINVPPYDSLFVKGVPLFTDNYEQVSPLHFGMTGYYSLASVPLFSKNMIIGALNVASKQRHIISEDEQQTLISIGRELGTIFERISAEEESKKAEKALEENESRLRSIIRVAPVGIGVAINRVIQSVNDQFCQITGYSADELIGKPARFLYPAQEDYDYVGKEKYGQIASKGHGSVETRFQKKDGKIIDVLLSSAPIDPSNLSVGVIFTALDITERKIAEKNLWFSERKFAAAFDASPDPMAITDIKTGALLDINHSFEIWSGYSREEISGKTTIGMNFWVYPEERDAVVSLLNKEGIVTKKEVALRTKTGEVRNILFSATVFGIGDHTYMLSVSEDITERKRVEEALHQAHRRLRSFIDANIVGVIIASPSGKVIDANDYYLRLIGYTREEFEQGRVDWRAVTPPEWLPADEQAIEELRQHGRCTPYEKEYIRRDGARVPVFLSDAMVPGPEEQIVAFALDITERKKVEVALRESEEKYRILVENAGEVLVVAQGRYLKFANPRTVEVTGYAREELLSRPFIEFIHPDDRSMVAANYQRRTGGEAAPDLYCFRLVRKDGEVRWMEIRAVPISWEGAPATLNFLIDITEKRIAEKSLVVSEEQSRTEKALLCSLIDALPFDVWAKHSDGRYILQNAQSIRLWGDCLNKTTASLVYPQDVLNHWQENSRKAMGGETVSGEFVWETGEICRVYHEIITPVTVQDDIIGIIGVNIDITGLKQVEEALRESDAQKKAILNGITTNIAFVDNNLKILWANRVAAESVDKQPAEMIGHTCHALWADPERPCENCPTLRAFESKKPEHTIMYTPDGRVWNERGEPVFDETGNLIGVVEIAQDITDRTRAEEALRESEKNLREAQKIARLGQWDLDLVNNILHWSEGIFEMFGTNPREFGATYEAFLELIHPDDREMVNRAYAESLKTRQPYEISHRLLMKEGRVKWVNEIGHTDYDSGGKPLRSVGIVQDISVIKQAEEALQKANRKLNLLSGITRHDINNQLFALNGFLELLHKKTRDQGLEDYFTRITRTSSLISTMIQFTSEYEQIGVHAPAWQDIRALVDTAEKEAPLGNIIVNNDLPAGTEVFADPLITKVFYNLMDNAVRYGMKITTIRFSVEKSGDGPVIVCEDDGVGVPVEEKEKIFER